MIGPRQWAKPTVQPREMWGWALYDFANSGYTTVVLTAVFNVYFVSVLAGGDEWGTFLWTLVISVSNALSMLVMPMVGAVADARANKRQWLAGATLLCVLGTVGLAFAEPGRLPWACVMLVVSNLAYNMGESLSSAFLPELAREESLGKASGWGWSIGYGGGLVALAGALLLVIKAASWGLTTDEAVTGTVLFTALLYAVAALPFFIYVKERSQPRLRDGKKAKSWAVAKASLKELRATVTHIKDYQDFARLSLCGFFFQCGVSVVITISAVYAAEVMHFTTQDTLLMIFVVNITAAIGALGFGWLQDRIGHKEALGVTLLLWCVMVVVAATSTSVAQFWVAANLAGLSMGSSQSAGRAMVGALAPASRLAEFFSFWNLSIWFAAVVGPITYGTVTWATSGDHRIAIWVTGSFFIFALLVLTTIDMERGKRVAKLTALDE